MVRFGERFDPDPPSVKRCRERNLTYSALWQRLKRGIQA